MLAIHRYKTGVGQFRGPDQRRAERDRRQLIIDVPASLERRAGPRDRRHREPIWIIEPPIVVSEDLKNRESAVRRIGTIVDIRA